MFLVLSNLLLAVKGLIQWQGDIEFICELRQEQYLMSEASEMKECSYNKNKLHISEPLCGVLSII